MQRSQGEGAQAYGASLLAESHREGGPGRRPADLEPVPPRERPQLRAQRFNRILTVREPGWTKYGFVDAEAWNAYKTDFARRLASPLEIPC
jgi:hypothetical protein